MYDCSVHNVPLGHKFTGKERDSESGLDNFGARYNSSAMGRFMSPDWSAIPAPVPYANLANPQALNLYAMDRNNPESFADLDGHGCNPDDGPVGKSSSCPQNNHSAQGAALLQACAENGIAEAGCTEAALNAEKQKQEFSQSQQHPCATNSCHTMERTTTQPTPDFTIHWGVSATVGNLTVSTDKSKNIDFDLPQVGISVDGTIEKYGNTDQPLGAVGGGLKHLGADLDVGETADHHLEITGATFHLGVSTPALPVHMSLSARPMSPEFIWILRTNPDARSPLR